VGDSGFHPGLSAANNQNHWNKPTPRSPCKQITVSHDEAGCHPRRRLAAPSSAALAAGCGRSGPSIPLRRQAAPSAASIEMRSGLLKRRIALLTAVKLFVQLGKPAAQTITEILVGTLEKIGSSTSSAWLSLKPPQFARRPSISTILPCRRKIAVVLFLGNRISSQHSPFTCCSPRRRARLSAAAT
jgi:hypothetical protein